MKTNSLVGVVIVGIATFGALYLLTRKKSTPSALDFVGPMKPPAAITPYNDPSMAGSWYI